MIDPSELAHHMAIVGSDGEHVGKVGRVHGSEIELAKMDLQSGLKHHLIPLSWVDYVEGDKVRLSLTRDQAKARWTERG